MAVIWYEVLTGCRPVGMASAKDYRDDCPNLWERFIKACLATDPTVRPQLNFLAPRIEALAVRQYVPCPKCHKPVHIASWKCPFCRCRFRLFTEWLLETNAGCAAFLASCFVLLIIAFILMRYFNVNAYVACRPLQVVLLLFMVLSLDFVREWIANFKTPLPETASEKSLIDLWGLLVIAGFSFGCGTGSQLIKWIGIIFVGMFWLIICAFSVIAFREERKKRTVATLKSFAWRHFIMDPGILWAHIIILAIILLFANQAYGWVICLMFVYYLYIEVKECVAVWSQNRKVDPHGSTILLTCDRDIVRGVMRAIIYSAVTLIAMGFGRHFKS